MRNLSRRPNGPALGDLTGSNFPSPILADGVVTGAKCTFPVLSTNQAAALAGTSGAPTSGNKFVTNQDPRLASIAPATAAAFDDEFNGGSLDPKWTTVHGDTGLTKTVANGTLVLHSTGDIEWNVLGQAIVAPFKITARVGLQIAPPTAGGYAGICVRDSGVGNYYVFLYQVNSGTFLRVNKYNASGFNPIGDFASSPFNVDTASGMYGPPLAGYLQVEVDATDIYFRYSIDGQAFTTLFTEPKATWLAAINQVGPAYLRGGTDSEAHFDWIRAG